MFPVAEAPLKDSWCSTSKSGPYSDFGVGALLILRRESVGVKSAESVELERTWLEASGGAERLLSGGWLVQWLTHTLGNLCTS